MFDSKALKDFPDKKRSKLYMWWLESDISDYYYDFVHNFITNPIYQVKRLFQWYWHVLRFDYDFDAHSIFAMTEYKLKRVEKALINGHAYQESQDMKALKLAIKLAGKLAKDDYDRAGYNRIERKWGKLVSWFTPIENSTNSTWHSKYEKENTEEDKAQCRTEMSAYFLAAEAKRTREAKWFYAILVKYQRAWWD
jgi:hypothetical protein